MYPVCGLDTQNFQLTFSLYPCQCFAAGTVSSDADRAQIERKNQLKVKRKFAVSVITLHNFIIKKCIFLTFLGQCLYGHF
jgi:hypothetical protein